MSLLSTESSKAVSIDTLGRGAEHSGRGHLYRGRFKCFPVEEDEHFIERPADWVSLASAPMTEREAEAVRTCITRNRPYGDEEWQRRQAKRLGLSHTLRCEGRPRATKPKN